MKSLVFSLLIFSGIVLLSIACNEGVQKDQKIVSVEDLTKDKPEVHGTELKNSDILLGTSLDKAMATGGKAIYEVKCQSCHRLTEEKLVGPGWKDVTKRRQPVWVMNMITNVEMMLDTDPEAQKLLEQCMVRMPNQNLTKEEARSVLEFMRSNDGVK